MNPFFAYLIKSTVSLALFYIVFKLVVSRDKMHSVNRFVLLGILVVSSIIPFADIPILQEAEVIPRVEVFRELVAAPVFIAPSPVSENIQTVQQTKNISINPYLLFYLLIISALFIRLLISVFRVLGIIHGAEKQSFQNIVLAVVKDFIQPFSFIKHIVISEKDYSENREIVVAHEYAHIKHLHAIDLLICELFTALHWFNPFMWFLRHDLKLIHEFQADQAVLNKGIDAKTYQLLVLQKSVGERRFAMANHFTQKPILKRLKMMQKKNRKQWNGVKLILFIPIVLLLLQAFARPEIFVEKASEFVPGVTQESETEKWLERWTVENIKHGVYQPDGLKSDDYSLGKRNILRIMLTRNDQYFYGSEIVEKEYIEWLTRSFLQGANLDGNEGPKFQEKEIPLIGKVKISKCIIKFNYDKASSIKARNSSLRIIGEVYLKARQEKANDLFNQNYFVLNEEKRDVVDQVVPILFGYSSMIVSKPQPIEILLARNGKIKVKNGEFLIDEFENHLINANESLKESYKKRGYEFPLIVSVKVESGVQEQHISQLKEALRKAKIQYVSYSSVNKSEWIMEKNVSEKDTTKELKKFKELWEIRLDMKLQPNKLIAFDDQIYSFEDFEKELPSIVKDRKEKAAKYNYSCSIVADVGVEKDVTETQKEKFIKILKDVDVVQIYSISENKKLIVKEVRRKIK